jgi:hypothetical protein
MRRFPWVSVALLIVLGLVSALSYPIWGASDADVMEGFRVVYLTLGWVGVGGALVIGALGVWARAPATLPTALGIIGAGAFTGFWLLGASEAGDDESLRLGMVVAYAAILVAFAASARRPSADAPDAS